MDQHVAPLPRMKRLEAFIGRHKYASFIVFALVMYVCMRLRQLVWGIGVIWGVDGVEQQYPFFIAEGRWLRELGASLLAGQPYVPQWTMLAGYGTDYVDVLVNTLGNPFNLLSVFSTPESAELLLTVAVFAQLLVAGLAFLRYCDYRGAGAPASIVGAVVYVFSGYSALMFTQLYMLYPLVLGPLVLLGIDKVFDRESPVLLVVSIALMSLYSITGTYACCLLLVVYCIVRYALLDEPASPLGFLKWFAKIFGLVALGVLIASALLVPSIMSLMGQGRLGLERPQNLFYGLWYYYNLITGLLYPVEVGADCLYGYAPVALLCCIALRIVRRKGDKTSIALAVMLVFMAAVLLSPVLGRVFNGFAYPNNRWVWAFSLAMGLAVAYVLPKLGSLDAARRRRLLVACVAVLVVYAALLVYQPTRYFAAALIIFAALVALLALSWKTSRQWLWKAGVLVSVPLWCVLVYGLYAVPLPLYDMGWGDTYELIVGDSPARMALAGESDEKASYHYDGAGYEDRRNACLALGVPGSSYYSSYYSSLVDEYHESLGLGSSILNFSYLGFDGRTALEALAGVKDYIAPAGDDSLVPSIYSDEVARVSGEEKDYRMLEAADALPLALRYDRTISRQSYDQLPMTGRQEALLQGMVVESGGQDAADMDYSMLESIPWEGGFSPEGGTIEVTDIAEPVTVNVDIPAGRTAYLEIGGLDYPNWALTAYTYSDLTFQSGEVGTYITQFYPSSHLYAGKNDWVISLGKGAEDRHEVEVRFTVTGTYTYSSFNVVLEDDEAAGELVGELSAAAFPSVTYERNEVSGPIDMGEVPGYVFFRVPCGDGWSATVDGMPAAIERANIGFMALWLGEGPHDVVLEYKTPGLAAGSALTLVGLVLLAALAILTRRNRPANRPGKHSRPTQFAARPAPDSPSSISNRP